MATKRRQPHRMLYVLFGISLALHVGIFICVNGLYTPKALTRIEVTIQERGELTKRIIPKPQKRIRLPEKTRDITRLTLNKPLKQNLEPLKIDQVEYGQLERVEIPSVPNIVASDEPLISVWNPRDLVAHSAYTSSNDYLAMVRFRIERHKKYPQLARTRQLEGEVIIHFVITIDGNVGTIKVIRSSGHTVLDKAGLMAVKNASPFPRPPAEFFAEEIPIEIPIVFELI